MIKPTLVDQYLAIFLLLVVGVLFAAGSFVASATLGPKKKPSGAKVAPYECGIVPDKEPPSRFPVRFYLVAMIFIIFDIEIVFLYPFAVIFRQLGSFGLVEVLIFSVVVFVSLLYLVSKMCIRDSLTPGGGSSQALRRALRGR